MRHKKLTMLEFMDWLAKATNTEVIEFYNKAYNTYLTKAYFATKTHQIRFDCSVSQAVFLSQAPEIKHLIRIGDNGEILEKPNMAALQEHVSESHKAWIKAGEDLIFDNAEISTPDQDTAFRSIIINHKAVCLIDRKDMVRVWAGNTIEEIIRLTKSLPVEDSEKKEVENVKEQS